MKEYLDKEGLQYYSDKLTTKYKGIFATKDEIGTPTKAATVSAMTDHDVIYLYTGSETGYTAGHIYYWNGSAWTDGGQYGSQALDTTLSVPGEAADAKATGDAIDAAKADVLEDVDDDYAKKNGAYPDLGAGTADQLNSNIFEEDQVPFNFRTAGGSTEIGDRAYVDEYVGVSLPWNQLIKASELKPSASLNGITATNNGDGTFTFSGTASSVTAISLQFGIPARPGDKLLFGRGKNVLFYTGYPAEGYGIVNNEHEGCSLFAFFPQGTVVDETIPIQAFNLTLMFGSTIADYVYSIESATAGSGIAWLKERGFFTKPYYAYDAGSMQSVVVGQAENTGFNQWDEEWEEGAYNNNGEKTTNVHNRIRNKNLIPILPSTTYYFKSPNTLQIYEYDINSVFLRTTYSIKDVTYTTGSDAYYLAFNTGANSGATYNHDICINLHWDGSRDGEYEPYVKHTYPLDHSITLRGIPKLDANNKLYWDGDTYKPSGEHHTKMGNIDDLGSLAWSSTSTYGNIYRAQVAISGAINSDRTRGYLAPMACSKLLPSLDVTDVSTPVAGLIGIAYNYIFVTFSSSMTSAEVKAALSGVEFVYGLATPTDSTADPFTSPQIVDDFGTESITDYLYENNNRDVEIPVGHVTRYTANLKAKLEMAPDSPSGDGDYVVRQTSGENAYVPLSSAMTNYNTKTEDEARYATKEACGGTLQNLLAISKSIDFANTAWVDLGTLTWVETTYAGVTMMVCYSFTTHAHDASGVNIICSKYEASNDIWSVGTLRDKLICNNFAGEAIFVYDSSYTDPATFASAMKGVLLAYEKASS